jgi:hypothetical protein
MKAMDDKTNTAGRQKGLRRRLKDPPGRLTGNEEKNDLLGYPMYPASEDIYSKYQEEKDINPEDISKVKESNSNLETNSKIEFNDNASGSDLDIPGAELDDNQESIGSEDEENNYYSLGGDNHNDLEEDKGE